MTPVRGKVISTALTKWNQVKLQGRASGREARSLCLRGRIRARWEKGHILNLERESMLNYN